MHDDLHNHAGSALGTTLPSVRNAQDLLQRDYERLRPIVGRIVGSRLRNAVGWVDEAVVDAAYNQAWHAVYLKLAEGESIDDLSALLVTITHRRAIDDLRTQHWDRQANETLDDQRSFEQDLDAQLDDQVRLQHAFEAMRDRLNQRERHAAVLCYVLGHSRPEAAVQLGVSRKRMEKIMDGVSGKLAQLTPGLGSRQWCRERAGLIRSYALGLLDSESERYAQAAQHLEGCAACRRQVLVVRGLGAIVPPWPLLILLKSSAVAGAGASAGVAATAGAPAAAAPAASSSSGPWSTIFGNVRPVTVVGAVATASVMAAVAAAAITQPGFLGGDNAKNEGAATVQSNVAPAAPGSSAGAGSGGAAGGSSASASKAAKKSAKAKAKASKPRPSSESAATAGAAGTSETPAVFAAAPAAPVEPASIEPSGTDAAAAGAAEPGGSGGASGGSPESGSSSGSSGSSGSSNGSSGSSKPDRPSKPQPSKPPQPDKLPVAKPPATVPPVVVPPVVTPPVAVPPTTTPTPPTPPVVVVPPVVVPPVDPPLKPPVDPPDDCTLLVNGVCVIP